MALRGRERGPLPWSQPAWQQSDGGQHKRQQNSMSVVACASPNRSLLGFATHDVPTRAHYPACASAGGGPPIVADATQLDLHAWNVVLMRQLLSRRRITAQERSDVRATIGHVWFGKGRNYVVLEHTLHHAVHDRQFQRLASDRRGLWLECAPLLAARGP